MERFTAPREPARHGETSLPAWREAEAAAHRYILQHGYQPIARNVRSRFGEIDIVARQDEELVFVEVKARRGHAAAQAAGEAVGPRKRGRLRRLALWYLQETGRPIGTHCRFDVVLVCLDRSGKPASVQVVCDAF